MSGQRQKAAMPTHIRNVAAMAISVMRVRRVTYSQTTQKILGWQRLQSLNKKGPLIQKSCRDDRLKP